MAQSFSDMHTVMTSFITIHRRGNWQLNNSWLPHTHTNDISELWPVDRLHKISFPYHVCNAEAHSTPSAMSVIQLMAVGPKYNTGYGGGEVRHQEAGWKLSREDVLQWKKRNKEVTLLHMYECTSMHAAHIQYTGRPWYTPKLCS